MSAHERYLERQRRYNRSEKGLARYRRYWNRRGGGGDRRKAERCERDDPYFAAYLRQEITWDELQRLDPLPPLRPLSRERGGVAS